MHSIFIKSIALLSFSQLLSAARIHIENTNPPANKYITHCSVVIDGTVFGCKDASAEPYPKGCGANKGNDKWVQICGSASMKVEWDNPDVKVTFRNNEMQESSCNLKNDKPGSSCEM